MDVMWGESEVKADIDYILSHTIASNICGIMIHKLSNTMEFISLCLHHYKDMNSIYMLSRGSLKLYLFCDIYFYLLNNDVSITELVGKCDRLNISEYIYYYIYYTNMIFDDNRLNEYLSALKNVQCENIIDTFGLDDIERKVWNPSFGERLFSERFYEEFNSLLGEKDIEKIRKNNSFM